MVPRVFDDANLRYLKECIFVESIQSQQITLFKT